MRKKERCEFVLCGVREGVKSFSTMASLSVFKLQTIMFKIISKPRFKNRKMKPRQVSTLRMGIFTPKRDYRVDYGEMTSVVATSRAQQFCLLLGKLLVVVKALSYHLGSRVTN